MRPRRSRALLAVAVGLCAAAAPAPAPAPALPGDPPPRLLAPADGASLAADPAGVEVSFACPRYFPTLVQRDLDVDAGPEFYSVRFSSSSETGGNGQLGDDFGSGQPTDRGEGTCISALKTDAGSRAPEIVGGRVFWQASRLCDACAGGVELSEVRSFTLRAQAPTATLSQSGRLYAGYDGVFSLRLDASTAGVRSVVLERRVGSRWRSFGSGDVSLDTTIVIGRLPVGRQRVRARVEVGGETFVVAERTVKVRADKGRRTSSRDDGAYRQSGLDIRVVRRGSILRRVVATVEAQCFFGLPTQTTRRTLIAVTFNKRIAPDGSVATYLTDRKSEGYGYLIGAFRGRSFRGSLAFNVPSCVFGTRLVVKHV